MKLMPYLIVDDAAAALAFYERAFGATITLRLDGPGDAVGHAEMQLPDGGTFSLASEFPSMDYLGPKARGGTTVALDLHVPDCKAAFAKAIEAGATVDREPEQQFYGYLAATVYDPFGHRWMIGEKVEEVSPEEMQRRYDAMLAGD
ncbi:MAG: VOC family protein [Deltaproteobacteria bacterium]|nr:VOC family protein [Deltaproteobacteria bacterium]